MRKDFLSNIGLKVGKKNQFSVLSTSNHIDKKVKIQSINLILSVQLRKVNLLHPSPGERSMFFLWVSQLFRSFLSKISFLSTLYERYCDHDIPPTVKFSSIQSRNYQPALCFFLSRWLERHVMKEKVELLNNHWHPWRFKITRPDVVLSVHL